MPSGIEIFLTKSLLTTPKSARGEQVKRVIFLIIFVNPQSGTTL